MRAAFAAARRLSSSAVAAPRARKLGFPNKGTAWSAESPSATFGRIAPTNEVFFAQKVAAAPVFTDLHRPRLGFPNFGTAWSGESHGATWAPSSAPRPRAAGMPSAGKRRSWQFVGRVEAAQPAARPPVPALVCGDDVGGRQRMVAPARAAGRGGFLKPRVLGINAEGHA